jgi:hypothetical protein
MLADIQSEVGLSSAQNAKSPYVSYAVFDYCSYRKINKQLLNVRCAENTSLTTDVLTR